MEYNPNYYQDGKMKMLRGNKIAIHTFRAEDGTLIGMFQGSRGDNPELDFQVKYLNVGVDAKPVLLPHVDWIVDILIKAQSYKEEMMALLQYYIDYYDTCQPFKNTDERAAFKPITLSYVETQYSNVKVDGTISIGGLAIILELFCLCEKQNKDAHQFLYSLQWTKECIEGKRNYRTLLNLAIHHREY
ncbi:MAG: hypothetical protein IJN06_04700 [Bacteroidales bacterium]|nr:hypothetical protein [Bacteroidales bacterium]